MAKGVVENVPDDGLSTKARRNRPLIVVHTGPGKGKSTAAFGLALRGWNQGFDIGAQIAERRDKQRRTGGQPSGEDQIGQNKIEPRARRDNKNLSPQALVRKGPATVVGCCGFRLVLPEQLDVPAERYGRDEILGFADPASE